MLTNICFLYGKTKYFYPVANNSPCFDVATNGKATVESGDPGSQWERPYRLYGGLLGRSSSV